MSDWRFNCDIQGFFNNNCCIHEYQWNLVSSLKFFVEMLPYFYLPSLFLLIPQSFLIMSDSIRYYQLPVSQAHFAFLLLKLLYLPSNHLGPYQATK